MTPALNLYFRQFMFMRVMGYEYVYKLSLANVNVTIIYKSDETCHGKYLSTNT